MAELRPMTDPLFALLGLSLPMIMKHTGGEKQAELRRAWREVATNAARRAIGTDVSGLPKDRTMAALACVDAALDLAQRVGLTRSELAEHFNLVGERAERVPPPEDETIERLFGLVLAFAAQALVEGAGEDYEVRHG